ncbi:hypothetical protein [Flavobacterium piscis]|uniref:Uncharacterized protein n=1 Tax=Flavobacterium piscis TaxID=1114874 RepID=A0ABU1YDX8_9FLAO|nr:hypothetical protein [Flavobacterium piscis]MDR7212313.1 hypothetical protein [Flavobacterium piscis]
MNKLADKTALPVKYPVWIYFQENDIITFAFRRIIKYSRVIYADLPTNMAFSPWVSLNRETLAGLFFHQKNSNIIIKASFKICFSNYFG